MHSIPIPNLRLPERKTNKLNYTIKDYYGSPSTLCGGCGHDSVTAAIIQACFELSIPPEYLVKMSGIGCSSKTPGYFMKSSHAFNSVHGRMPAIVMGSYLAHRNLSYLAISGDGDTGSIGIGQFIHAVRRKQNMLYIIENNGVYGLTKGQFSALADKESVGKQQQMNPWDSIDPLSLSIQLGASFVARGFSGDKTQLVPLIKAGLKQKGFSLIEVLSPCVTFNNHSGSTRSYAHIREKDNEAIPIADFVPPKEEIAIDYQDTIDVKLHDESVIRLKKTKKHYNPSDKDLALAFINSCKSSREIATGLLYLDKSPKEYHEICTTDHRPLRDIPYQELCPGNEALAQINADFR